MVKEGKVALALRWQILNICIQVLFQFVFLMISARILEKEVHGAFAILNALIFVLSFASEGGVSSAIIQRKKLNSYHISISFYLTLFLSLFIFLFTALLAGPIETFYDHKVSTHQIRLASSIFIFKALGGVSRAFLVKNFRFKELFISNSLSFLIGSICVMYLLAIRNYGIYSLIYGFLTTQFIQSLLYYMFAKHSFILRFSKVEFKQIAYFGSSFTLLRITNYISSQVDKLILGKFYSLQALSIYEKGQYISKIPPKFIGNSIDSILFSYFSKINIEKKKNIFSVVFLVLGIFSSYLAVLFYFNSTFIINVLLSDQWLDSNSYFKILVFASPALLFTRLGDIIVRSENKMFSSLPIKVGYLLLVITIIFLLRAIPLLDLTKVLVIIIWLHAFSMLFLAIRLLHLNYRDVVRNFAIIILVTSFLAFKYFIINQIFSWKGLVLFILNLVIDFILLSGLICFFRKSNYIKIPLTILKEKFLKK